MLDYHNTKTRTMKGEIGRVSRWNRESGYNKKTADFTLNDLRAISQQQGTMVYSSIIKSPFEDHHKKSATRGTHCNENREMK